MNQQSKNKIKAETVIAKNWANLGIHYVKTRYYLKALSCFKTALSVDSKLISKKYDFII